MSDVLDKLIEDTQKMQTEMNNVLRRAGLNNIDELESLISNLCLDNSKITQQLHGLIEKMEPDRIPAMIPQKTISPYPEPQSSWQIQLPQVNIPQVSQWQLPQINIPQVAHQVSQLFPSKPQQPIQRGNILDKAVSNIQSNINKNVGDVGRKFSKFFGLGGNMDKYKYIVDPVNGKNVDIASKKGKQILKHYLEIYGSNN